MPMSPHRPALAAILVALIAAVFPFSWSAAQAATTDPSHPIVARALQDLGSYQGECWTWMKQVVSDATGASVGFHYREGYLDAGAVEVPLAEAQPGDVVQIAMDSWSSADADYAGLHTAIILEVNADGTFEAIDSNQAWDGIVRLRPSYNPAAQAAANGLDVHVYRFAGALPSVAKKAPGPLAAGDVARVNTPGESLRLRAEPGGSILRELPHDTRVTIVSGPVVATGIAWYQVSTSTGDGWMAGEFLLKVADPAATQSGAGAAQPVFQFRAFVPFAALD